MTSMSAAEIIRQEARQQLALARQRAVQPVPASSLRLLTGLALALMVCAAGLWAGAGYRFGFVPLNALGAVLPVGVWSFVTSLGDTAVALALFLPLSRGNWHLCRVVMISALLGLAWTHGIKHVMPLPRPPAVLEPGDLIMIGDLSASGSFPSGHAQTAMLLAGVAVLCAPGMVWRWLALGLGLLAALSRVPVGMHWPVDTLAGAAGGIVTTLIALVIARRLGPPSAWSVALVLGLSALAALVVISGHPHDHPAAQPWLRLIGAGALLAFVRPFAQRLIRGAS
ncbi:MAG: phosphatase PAP2 family protein [Pseudomonadota bacterium]